MSVEWMRTSSFTFGFIILCCLFYYWGWSTEISSFGGDSAGYMLAAQYYSPYQSPSAVVEEYSRRIIYPPLFPWLLAFSSGGTNILAAHLTVITFLLASLLPFYSWLKLESCSRSVAAAICVLFAAMPTTRYISMSIWTENVYLFFSLVGVWAATRATKRSINSFWYIAAIAIACATLTRVAALPLLLAFGMFLLIKKPSNWITLICIASIPIVLWLILGHREQTGITGYTDVWKARYSNDALSFFWTKLIEQLLLIEDSWVVGWTGMHKSSPLTIISAGFGIFSIIGFLSRVKSIHFDTLYVAIYLVVLLAWHSSGEVNRYLYVIFPFFVFYGHVGTHVIVSLFDQSSRIHWFTNITMIGILLLTIAPTLIIDSKNRLITLPIEVETARQTDFWYVLEDRALAFYNIYNQAKIIEHFKTINQIVPESDCIFSIKPTVLTFYTGRQSFVPPAEKSTDNEFRSAIDQCKYAYGFSFTSLSYSQPLYPIQRLGSDATQISSIDNQLLKRSASIGILVKISKDNAKN